MREHVAYGLILATAAARVMIVRHIARRGQRDQESIRYRIIPRDNDENGAGGGQHG